MPDIPSSLVVYKMESFSLFIF